MMNGWFLTLIIIYTLSLGIELVEHGKPKKGKHSFWGTLIGSVTSLILIYMAIKTGF